MAFRVGMKRSRDTHKPKTATTARLYRAVDPAARDASCAMVVDDMEVLHDSGADADKDDDDDDDGMHNNSDSNSEQPRRKRAMVIKANIQFLQKLQPLQNDHRGRFGRRGAVDGGTPESEMGIHALEESMGESSFFMSSSSSREPVQTSRAAAMVAPVAPATNLHSQHQYPHNPYATSHHHYEPQRQHQYQYSNNSSRNTSMAFASHPTPFGVIQNGYFHGGNSAAMSSMKDDEARPAMADSKYW
uniref:Uncharacterized protein n=1 Tax=Globisporangium ultimum (strain ATCC 200006 / CBS 805.95 / DAOM BR144) TaxID=431595 RepID=K3X5V8_GLOUD